MKRRVVAIALLIVLTFSNLVFAYERNGGSNLDTIATVINDNVYVDGDFNAYTNMINRTNVEIYDYNSTTTKQCVEQNAYSVENKNQYYLTSSTYPINTFGEGEDYLFYTIKLKEGTVTEKDIGTFIYKDGLIYNGEVYDVKLNIAEINKTGEACVLRVLIACGNTSEENKLDINTYNEKFEPALGINNAPLDGTPDFNVAVNVEYYAVDDEGTEIPISGLFKVSDIDNNQGYAIKEFAASKENTYIKKAFEEIKYKTENNSTYIYYVNENNEQDTNLDEAEAYLLIENKNKLDMTFTFDSLGAHSSVSFVKDIIKSKYKITYDAKGGTPTPETEYVIPKNKATEPNNIPTKEGYEFKGWIKKGETTVYDFNNEVTSNIELEANWNPVVYRINYELNGGQNNSNNPDTYTIKDNVNFQPAVRDTYDFIGWYKDEEFTTPIDSLSNHTGDVTIYAKWEKSKDIAYKVEHYKEKNNGEYELVLTENLTDEMDKVVTAKVKEYAGFKENLEHEQRVNEGTVKADGSLVLKVYYAREEYKVTFEPKNNTKIDEQIVKYQDKAKEPTNPTKVGHKFKYWYYTNENGKEVKYNFDDEVTKDINLIAKWEEIPTISDNISKEESPKEETPKKDDTEATQKLPNTGNIAIKVIILPVILLLVVFGIKYFKLKKIIK